MSSQHHTRVRFVRTHYPAGNLKPYLIGQEIEFPAEEARSLASYGIVQILGAADRSPADRLPSGAVVARIEQLMPAADQGEEAAIAELERLRDQELAGGVPRASVLAVLRKARIQGVPAAGED